MTQELVDRIENEKFIKSQREAQEKADREAKLSFVPVSEEAAEAKPEGNLTPPPADPLTSDAPIAPTAE